MAALIADAHYAAAMAVYREYSPCFAATSTRIPAPKTTALFHQLRAEARALGGSGRAGEGERREEREGPGDPQMPEDRVPRSLPLSRSPSLALSLSPPSPTFPAP